MYFGLGTKLARDVGEFMIMRSRLEIADKKKVLQLRDWFRDDCRYNVATFQVEIATDRFSTDSRNSSQLVS